MKQAIFVAIKSFPMRTLYIFVFTCFFSFSTKAGDTLQYQIDGFHLNEINVPFVEAVICPKPFSTKFFIDIDYGQENRNFNQKDTRLSDQFGNFIEFKSRISALNFLINLGYEIFEFNYLFDSSGDIAGQRLLLKKKE